MTTTSFIDLLKSIIKLSGGDVTKINLSHYIELLNDSFVFNPFNYWLGIKIQKSPLDLMVLQEIIFEKKPDTIIECGTAYGGSAYFLATLMDLMGIDGQIITIDQEKFPPVFHPERSLMDVGAKGVKMVNVDFKSYLPRPVHPKIKYLYSDCLTAKLPKLGAKTMVILDCEHHADHVYSELEKYSSLVTPGQYLIVEDTIYDKSIDPIAAVKKFLAKNKNFVPDKNREKHGLSSNLGGYLFKIS